MDIDQVATKVEQASPPCAASETLAKESELQALIEEAGRRARRRRRRAGTAAASTALLVAGLSVLVVRLTDHRAQSPAGSSESRAGARALAPGRFWYTRAVTPLREWAPAGGITLDRRGFTHRHGSEVLFDVRWTQETWVGFDGTIRERSTSVARFASARGRATWAAYGRPLPNFNDSFGEDAIVVGGNRFPPQLWYPWGEGVGPYSLDLGDGLLSYGQLASLPTEPRLALDLITRSEQALLRRQDRTSTNVGYPTFPAGIGELTDIGGLLAAPISATTRLTLLHAAALLRGARVDQHARDQLGRRGVSVTSSAGMVMQRLIVDPATGALLQGPKGVVVAQGPVGSAFALPRGVSPIRVEGGRPQPAELALSPQTGGRATVFTLTFTPTGQRQPHEGPALDWIVAGTPGPRCFAIGFPRPLSPVASIRRADGLSYLYRLYPPTASGWCTGRYELQVTPDYSRHPWHPVPKADGSPTFSAGEGSSIYFRVGYVTASVTAREATPRRRTAGITQKPTSHRR